MNYFRNLTKNNQRKKICIHNHNNREKVSRGNFIRLVLGHHREKPEYITNKHNERYTEFIEKWTKYCIENNSFY